MLPCRGFLAQSRRSGSARFRGVLRSFEWRYCMTTQANEEAQGRALQNARSDAVIQTRLKIWEVEAARQIEEREKRGGAQRRMAVVMNEKGLFSKVNLAETRPADLSWVSEQAPLVARISKKDKPEQGVLWDLNRTLNDLELDGQEFVVVGLGFNSVEGQQVFWHSSAHLLGFAIEREFGADSAWLSDGPPLASSPSDNGVVGPGQGGFFYDVQMSNRETVVGPEQIKSLNSLMLKSFKGKSPFERLELSHTVAREMFSSNPRKLEMIDKLVSKGSTLTAYRCGNFVDLCRGPHIPAAETVLRSGGVKVLSANAINDGKEQRVYGITFPSKELLKDWVHRTEEAAKRNHRVVGKRQNLFMFHQVSPGCAFMLPHGTVVYNKLLSMLRDQYTLRGYEEVMTPLMYSSELWKKSGHWENYRENMFQVTTAAECSADDGHKHDHENHDHDHDHDAPTMGLKPMNCPGHCLLFAQTMKSFRDLPVRFADFSSLHRNEVSGSLGGMTRLRRFQQDDAHIFCMPEQIHSEISDCIAFLSYVYKDLFDFDFSLRLSTRNENKYIGEVEEWAHAESTLAQVLDSTGLPWTIDPGEGAFYGPKIDCSITDTLGRQHQCATIQLDFQLPKRFDLEFTNSGGERQRPVMIHRAMLGSVERFMAILIEHTNGRFPFWLSPRQVAILPVSPDQTDYANMVATKVRSCCCHEDSPLFLSSNVAAGLCVAVDSSNETLAKRVRTAQQAPFNVIVVVGQEEVSNRTVSIRSNDGSTTATIPLDEFLQSCATAVKQRLNVTFPTGKS